MTSGIEDIEMDEWLFVLVDKSGNNEQIVGQHDTAHDIRFIPAFKDRDSALKGGVKLDIDINFEIQAIIYEDLLRYAGENQSLVLLLDSKGSPLLKIAPDGRTL